MLSSADLERALEPVRGYFSGRVITPNTVLAARLRAASVPTQGPTWETAKAVLANHADFDEAVRRAEQLMHGAHAGTGDGTPAPRRGLVTAEQPFSGTMEWFPKRFREGDIDGQGARKLLGVPNLDSTTLLVREMAQNAWDARGASASIRFTVNLREVTGPALETLRTRVFTGESSGLGLKELLARPSIWCLEVSDRGTVGLNGPIRNDRAIEPGVDRNFVDLVFNIGAPRDTHLGGGTYGFGKTISYVISNVGTVLIWSRAQGMDGYEERFIGSAMGDNFDRLGRSYTGRHWWGHVVDDGDRVEPVVGGAASGLGAAVFQDRFGTDETGTSFLILDPDLTGETPEEKVKALRDAVLDNLWPKLMRGEKGRSAMGIDVFLNGTRVVMPQPEDAPALRGYTECLGAVRRAQRLDDDPSDEDGVSLVRVVQIRSQRPKKLLGHLALVRQQLQDGEEAQHHVSLMRHGAELVVKKQAYRKLDVPGFQWMGVFKPAEHVDDSFAAAEPPAHDDWVPNGVKDKSMARDVRVALREIGVAVEAYLAPTSPTPGKGEVVSSVAHVGDLLADMVGSLGGPGPSLRKRPAKEPATRKERRTGITIDDVEHATGAKGWDLTTLRVTITPAGGDASVDLLPRVGVEGPSQEDADAVFVHGWSGDGQEPWMPGPLPGVASGTWYFRYESRPGLAIDVLTSRRGE